ncbi:hypothetical protein SCARD494_04768 [Seiridium cardinale]
MVQRKLDYYLQRSTQPEPSLPCTSSFLDLPYQIRRRIYLLVGLVRVCPVNLNQEGPRARYYLRKGDQPSDYACFFESRKFMGALYELDCRPACHCLPLPFSLLYISRAITEEVSHILYSENSFIISRSDAWGLKPLRNLNTTALSSLRILTIRLNNCECLYDGAFQHLQDFQGADLGLFSCHPLCQPYGFHDQPLRSQARQHMDLLREWQGMVYRLAAYCRLDSLRLDLICNTQDTETAHDVVNSLSPIPNLRACSIRLSQNPSWQHFSLAAQAVSRLVDHFPEQPLEKKPSTYRLPPEILSHILEYSELVAPFDLEWSPDRGLVPFDCCKKCTATLDCCTCSFYHGAYSRSCTCWRLPLSIFLVSRQVYDIAKTIFFQRNRFIVVPEGGRVDDLRSCRVAFPALATLFRRLPPHTASLLRSIGLVVSLPSSELGAPYTQLLTEWGRLIRLLATSCDVKNLSLALFMGHTYEVDMGPGTGGRLQSYQILTRQLVGMDHLRDLFIYIQWPVSTFAENAARYSSELEKEILGPGYDSEARGKLVRLPKLWYNGMSREGPVFAADGRRIWPRPYCEDAYGPPAPPPCIYV